MEEILVIQLTLQELKEVIYDVVKLSLSEFKEEFRKEQQVELLTRKEVAEMLRISLPTLHQWTKVGKLKGYKKSGRVYFKRNEVINALESKYQ